LIFIFQHACISNTFLSLAGWINPGSADAVKKVLFYRRGAEAQRKNT